MKISLNDTRLSNLLAKGWALTPNAHGMTRHWQFADFTTAFSFMTQSAFFAEKWNHHPDWRNSYAQVWVTLTTHDAGGLTDLDLKLADKMETLSWTFPHSQAG